MLHLCTLLEVTKLLEVREATFKENKLQIRTNLRTFRTTSHRRERIWLQARDLGVLNPLLRRRWAVVVQGFATHLRSLVASLRQRCRSMIARVPVVDVLVRP